MLLSLPDGQNPFMRATAEAAARAAQGLGIALDTLFADADYTAQVRQLCNAMRDGTPRSLLMVMPIEESAVRSVSEQALQAGIGWFWLSRSVGNEGALRERFPDLPVSLITPDQRESGRQQARQLMALLPKGGRVLHVLGRMSNQSARLLAQGFEELLANAGPAIEVVAQLDGRWSADVAREAVTRWLSVIRSTRRRPEAIVCQNDAMADGVAQALRALASETGDAALAQLPIIGVDGLPSVGQRLVDDGTLAATILLPITTGPAMRAAATYILSGVLPAQEIVLEPKPYPSPTILAHRRPSVPPSSVLKRPSRPPR